MLEEYLKVSLADLELSVNAEISSVPVTATSKGENVLNLNCGHNVIIVLQPVVAGFVDPAYVVTTIS
jgi:hypothetical protein